MLILVFYFFFIIIEYLINDESNIKKIINVDMKHYQNYNKILEQ